MLRTNIRGTFVVNQQAARRLRTGGSIVDFSSSVLGRILPTYTSYAATKAAVDAMTFILAHELRGRDITLCPRTQINRFRPLWSYAPPPPELLCRLSPSKTEH